MPCAALEYVEWMESADSRSACGVQSETCILTGIDYSVLFVASANNIYAI